jgi:signal transduction histidine kinase
MAIEEERELVVAKGKNNRTNNNIITTIAYSGEIPIISQLTDTQKAKGNTIRYATEVLLNTPTDVFVDPSGNLYVVEINYHRIVKVNTNGVITTIAGTGSPGYFGDGGPALNAILQYPQRMCMDNSGNILFVDSGNRRIGKIDTNGIITTIAGTGISGFSGDGKLAIHAELYDPNGICIDNYGNIFFSDYVNQRVRKIDPDGIITTVAGNGLAGFGGDGGSAVEASLHFPTDVVIDADGNLFIADSFNNRVRRVDQSGVISTLVGTGGAGLSGDGGLAVNATIDSPRGLFIDQKKYLYIAAQNSHAIRKVDSTGMIHTVAGTGEAGYSGDDGPAIQATLYNPVKVFLDTSGNMYIADQYNQRIRKVNTNGIITTVAGNGENELHPPTGKNSDGFQFPLVLFYVMTIVFIIGFSIYYYFLRKQILESQLALTQKELDLIHEKEARLLVEKEMQFISEREQIRIGQDIHDGILQQLTGIQLMGKSFTDRLQKNNAGIDIQYMNNVNELLMKSINQLRGLSRGLYPIELNKNGLLVALEEMVDTVEELYHIQCILISTVPSVQCTEMTGINVFRIVQEAVNNAVKHSKANHISIQLLNNNQYYSITIEDDGIGMNLDEFIPHHSKGMGISIMKYRADIISAELSISSELGKGTLIQCKFPIHP